MSTAFSEAVFGPPGYERALIVRRSRQARRMRLSVDPRNGAVTLSLPWRASLKPALNWADAQWSWVEQALAKLPRPSPIVPGEVFRSRVRICWSTGPSIAPAPYVTNPGGWSSVARVTP